MKSLFECDKRQVNFAPNIHRSNLIKRELLIRDLISVEESFHERS